MGNHVNNQHTVPRFLLKHFSTDNLNVWTFDKQHNQTKKRSIDSLTVEKNIYDRLPGEKEGSYEYNFQRAEDAAAPVVAKIICDNSIVNLSIDEKAILSSFIGMQFSRVKNAQVQFGNIDKIIREKTREFMEEAGIEMEVPDGDLQSLWVDSMDNAESYAHHISNKAWFLIKSDAKFYSSDNPIVLGNHLNYSTVRGNLGLNSKGIEIYFPLSASLLLAMYCKGTYGAPKNKELIIKDPTYYNSLQTIYANRFVIASDNNFELATDMIAKQHAFFNPLNQNSSFK